MQTDLARLLIKMLTFIIWQKQEQFNSFNATGLYAGLDGTI